MTDNTESKVMPKEGTQRSYDYKLEQFEKRYEKAKFDIILAELEIKRAELEIKQIEVDKMLLDNN